MALAGLLLLAACQSTHVYMNEALPKERLAPAGGVNVSQGGYRFGDLHGDATSQGYLLLLSFSGGGKRSAAFSYGVLQGLRELFVEDAEGQRPLLEEVDYISAVSGGSFTAAYYGLHREKIFSDYLDEFLREDLEGDIYGIYLLPWNWEWLINPFYGTNDAMAQRYDDLMFHGATYADLQVKGQPFISINATDVGLGTVFPFTQAQFDLICSDLSRFPLARAVAASNGFPVLFTPITLESYAEDCDGRVPGWLADAPVETEGQSLSREQFLAELTRRYTDPEEVRYVHLLDGGISDNLALRALLDSILVLTGDPQALRHLDLLHVHTVLMISADGQAAASSSWPQQRVVTSIGQIFSAVSGAQIDRYNFETLLLAKDMVGRLSEQLSKARCATANSIDGRPCDQVEGHLLHVSLANIADPKVRERLQAIPTGLTLDNEDIDLLIEAGRTSIRQAIQDLALSEVVPVNQ